MKLIAILVAFLALPLCSASPPGLRITSDEVAADMSRRSGGTCKSSWCASPDQTNRSAFDCFVDLTDNADKCLCQRGVAVLSAPYVDVKPGVSKDWSFSRSLGEFGKQELQRYMCCEDISNPRFSNLDSITSDKIAGETCGRDNLDTYERKRFFTNLCFLLFLFIICVPAGIWLAKKIVDFIIWWRGMDAVPDDIESNTRGCQATESDIEMSVSSVICAFPNAHPAVKRLQSDTHENTDINHPNVNSQFIDILKQAFVISKNTNVMLGIFMDNKKHFESSESSQVIDV